MRSDNLLDKTTVDSGDWESDSLTDNSRGDVEVDRYKLPRVRKAKMSLSGSERNHLFIKDHHGVFVDVSGNSGLDSANDGRAIAVFDFDRDGFQDFLLTNANGQTLNLFRNQVGELESSSNFVAIRLVGGNKNPNAIRDFSNRDGIGARVTVTAGAKNHLRELHCGEGLAAQNSQTLIVGLDLALEASKIKIVWPSGLTQQVKHIKSHSLVTFFEDNMETHDGTGVYVADYKPAKISEVVSSNRSSRLPFEHAPDTDGIAVYTAMATWCPTCQKHLPELNRIKSTFGGTIPVYAIPIDGKDDTSKLAQYMQEFQPAYELLPPNEERGRLFTEFVRQKLDSAALPFSVVTSADGTIVQVLSGLPTLSELKNALISKSERLRPVKSE